MKKIFTFAASLAIAAGMMAQNHDHIHIFRNDKAFNTYKAAEVNGISFSGNNGTYNKMTVTSADGKTESINMDLVDSCVVRTKGIPEFHVYLTDYPDWTELQGSKGDVRAATLRMDGNGMYDDLPEQKVEFRGRGNSTWNMAKKPYRFKMSKKASVCGLPKAKTFALLANYIDCSLMRNVVAMWVANYLKMPYANHMIPVKVYLNGIYKGAYMLTEKIGIGGGSVDIEETTGMLFELDTNYDEDFKFWFDLSKYTTQSSTPRDASNYIPVMVKDPDLTELAEDASVTEITDANAYFEKWKTDFVVMAKAIMSRQSSESLSDVIDIESAVNFFIVNNIAANHEMKHPKSFYLHKESLDGSEVYHFGPVWDFDWAFTFDGAENASPTAALVDDKADREAGGYPFLKKLFQNKEFMEMYKQKWDDFVKDGYPQLKEYMEEYAMIIEPSAKENGLLWPADYSVSWRKSESSWEFRKNFNALKAWIENRVAFVSSDSNFGLYK